MERIIMTVIFTAVGVLGAGFTYCVFRLAVMIARGEI